MKPNFLSPFAFLATTALLSVFSISAFAQDPHAGHNHQAPAQNYVEAPPAAIDHVYTESPNDHVMGANTAPITVIAYASVMCPHCAQWFTTEWPVFKERHIDTGQVRFVFREFPTSPVNYARTGFVIANCAPTERYFEQIVYQMQNQSYIFSAIQAGQARPMYQSLAYQAGLETPQQMQACFADPDSYQRMDKAILRAQNAGIQSVPGFIIDGQVFKGDSSAAGLAQAINARFSQGVTRLPTRRPAAPVYAPQKSMMTPIPQRQAPQQMPAPAPQASAIPQTTPAPRMSAEPRVVPEPQVVAKPQIAATPMDVSAPDPAPEPSEPAEPVVASKPPPVPALKPAPKFIPKIPSETELVGKPPALKGPQE